MASKSISNALAAYRAGVTALDLTAGALAASLFSVGTVPIIPVVGAPNVAIQGRMTNASDVVGVTLVALNQDTLGNLTVVGKGYEVTLTGDAVVNDAAGKFMSPISLSDAYGSQSPVPRTTGPVTHVAWIVTTAPTGSRAVDLWSWSYA